MTKYELLWADDSSDYYEGSAAALFIDGKVAWCGYSGDEVENILKAVLGAVQLRVGLARGVEYWRDTHETWQEHYDQYT